MTKLAAHAICAMALSMLPTPSHAARTKLTAEARTSAINGVLRCLNEGYVFPEVAKKMETAIRERAARKEYDTIEDGNLFAERLTVDLRSICHDGHVRVEYSEDILPPENTEPLKPSPEEWGEMKQSLARQNYGFPKVEVLKGNIGYLRCDLLVMPEIAGDTYAAAMNYLASTDALIIDLRQCSGAISMDAIPLLCGYFFENSVHLNNVYWRPNDWTQQSWSWAYVPGKRYLNKPLYVLTSGRSFSGAEELAYDLQTLKRATIIGDTTGGGANPGGDRRADDHFTVFVPIGRAINPITKTNWEGVGVKPDVPVSAARALQTAHQQAVQKIMEGLKDSEWKTVLKNTLEEIKQEQPQRTKVTFSLKGYPDAKSVTVVGSFNYWAIRANPMLRKGDTWTTEVELEPGRHTYKFLVDGLWLVDPANPATEKDRSYTNSVLIVK